MAHRVLVKFSEERQNIEAPGTQPKLLRAYASDAGWDLAAWLPLGHEVIWPGGRFAVPTGICICAPEGVGVRIIGRSSTYYKYGLEVSESLIDPGYHGALKIRLINRTDRAFPIENGMRLAQVIFFPILEVDLSPTKEFPLTSRGEAGLGSSGI